MGTAKKTLMVLVGFISILPLSFASETDPYTYSSIKLKDSKSIVNAEIQKHLDKALIITNKKIEEILFKGKSVSAKEIEIILTQSLAIDHGWLSFLTEPNRAIMSHIEKCIMYNNCKNWPFVERIVLTVNESIFGRAKYNHLTKSFLGTMINLCGYRLGADKISHFLDDGFAYYNSWMNGLSKEGLKKVMDAIEKSSMGGEFTGVYSKADIAANYSGIKFYRSLLHASSPYFKIKNKKLVQVRDFIICDYVSDLWDETINKNIYTQKNSTDLLEVIENESKNPSKVDRENLLNRDYISPGPKDYIKAWWYTELSTEGLKTFNFIFTKKFNYHRVREVNIQILD